MVRLAQRDSCLSEDVAAGFLERRLSAEQRKQVEAHIDICADCRRLMVELARSRVAPSPPTGSHASDALPEQDASGGLLTPGAAVGRFVVLHVVGAGGMGVVYAAYDPELDRKVAVKVMHPRLSSVGEVARARLLREAQTLAKLSHPNVVPVFEVGAVLGSVYIAMEYIAGPTLRDWLRATPRGWREVLGPFIEAARGLAAAQAHGLIHRDFKPDNVIIGEDGRARIIDFGIARLIGDQDEHQVETLLQEVAATRLDQRALRTGTGALVGTPRYMAPEQFEGGTADARTDQFNFCVSLYEALYGERPFPGDDLEELRRSVLSGKRRSPPPDSNVPRYLANALDRGLARSPGDRFATLEDLVAAITPSASLLSRRGWLLAAAAGGLVITSVITSVSWALTSGGREHSPCAGVGSEVRAVWNAERSEAAGAAFAATGLSYAASTWQEVERTLGRFADSWQRARHDVCLATAVRKEHGSELAELRTACLDQRLRELRAMAAIFEHPDRGVVDSALDGTAALSSLADCSELAALRGRAAIPAPLRDPLARISTLYEAGKYRDGIEAARSAAAVADKLQSNVGRAHVHYWLGRLEARLGQAAQGAETLFEAIRFGAAARDTRSQALAWTALVPVFASLLDRPLEAERWARHASVAVENDGSDATLAADLAQSHATAQRNLGRDRKALEEFRRAMALAERAYGRDTAPMFSAMRGAGIALFNLRRFDEAIELLTRAMAGTERTLGAAHPLLASAHVALGAALSQSGQYDRAHLHYEKAIEIYRRAFGEDSPDVGSTIANLGLLETRRGNLAAGEKHLSSALELWRHKLGEKHPRLARVFLELAEVAVLRGDIDRAEALTRESLQRFDLVGALPRQQAAALGMLCDIHRRKRQHQAALGECRRALEILERDGQDERHLAGALTRLAVAELDAGNAASAREHSDRALAIDGSISAPEHEQADTLFAAARAQMETGGDRARAVGLARQAMGKLEAAHPGNRQLMPRVRAWLAGMEAKGPRLAGDPASRRRPAADHHRRRARRPRR